MARGFTGSRPGVRGQVRRVAELLIFPGRKPMYHGDGYSCGHPRMAMYTRQLVP